MDSNSSEWLLKCEALDNDELLDYVTAQVIVIGAGVSGLSAAKALNAANIDVCIVEKSRGTGGRLASKRIELQSAKNNTHGHSKVKHAAFDLGASTFTAKTSEFKHYLHELVSQSLVAKVAGCVSEEYVGTPRNSMLTRHMSQGLDIQFNQKITRIEYKQGKWYLFAFDQAEEVIACCHHLILSSPAEQTHALLPKNHWARDWVRDIKSDPVFVSVLIFNANCFSKSQLNLIALLESAEIKSVSIEHIKPERDAEDYQVIKLTSSTQWARQHLDQDMINIEKDLLGTFNMMLQKLDIAPAQLKQQYTHKWLYAQYTQGIKHTKGFLSFSDNLHVVGDYFDIEGESGIQNGHVNGGLICDVEKAYLSGQRLAYHLFEIGAFTFTQSQLSLAESL